ncbi:MAG: hypothetical protein WA954_04900 [Parerythrobacter sp.]
MTHKFALKTGASLLMLATVSACDNNNDIIEPDPVVTPAPTPTPTTGSFQSQFGNAFAAIFDRDVTEDPVDPQQDDVPPLAPASDPLDNT